MRFHSMMPLLSNDSQLVRLEFDEMHWSIATVESSGKKVCNKQYCHAEGLLIVEKSRKVHAEGLCVKQFAAEIPRKIDLQAIIERCTLVDTKGAKFLYSCFTPNAYIDLIGYYDQLRYFADYGPIFQRLLLCYMGDEEAIAKIRGSSQDLQES